MHIVHVADIELSYNTGMGRIALEWKKSFERNGHTFHHINSCDFGFGHILFSSVRARIFLRSQVIKYDLILAHEPLAGFLGDLGLPLIVFSHGIESRCWEVNKIYKFKSLSFKNMLIPDKLRFISNTRGFRNSDLILLSNQFDRDFLLSLYPELLPKINIFNNGYYPFKVDKQAGIQASFLFNSSWIPRKGIRLLSDAFNFLMAKYDVIKLTIAVGSGNGNIILNSFESRFHDRIRVFENFSSIKEAFLYSSSSIFVLPSYFEGQSLALTQAMAMGLCPLVSDNSGQLDLVINEFNGIFFETGNLQAFISKLEFAILNPDLVSSLGENAAKSVSSRNWTDMGMEIVNLCEAVYSFTR